MKVSKHNKLVLKKTGKAINQFKMIEDGDDILVGLSGGKDSLVLLDILSKRREIIPINYHLHAMHVNVINVPYESNIDYLETFCKDRGIVFSLVEIEVDFQKKSNKKPCFLCAWERRKRMFDYAIKEKFNKIALGHNLDDALETLLMNMLHHANISSLPGKLSMFNNSFELIRPLTFLFNSDTKLYVGNNGFKLQEHTCPYEDKTYREQAGDVLRYLSALNKKAKENLFNSMGNIDMGYLPKIDGSKKII